MTPGTRTGRVRHRRRVARTAAREGAATLVAAASAVARLLGRRGVQPDQPFIVPLSVDRRRKGEPGPVFGNFLSFHFARIMPDATNDRATAISGLRREMAEAVRTAFVDGLWAGMNFVRYYPPRHLLRPLGGRELASFYCADTGEVRPPLPTLLGVPVRSAYHAPCVHPHPGLGLFFTRIGDVESVVAVWVEGVLTLDEVERVLDDVGGDIAATPAA